MKIKKLISTGAAAILAMSTVFATSVSAAEKENIVIFGDSIASGYKATKSFAQILSEQPSADVTNKAAYGTNTSALLASINSADLTNVDSVIISAGANDYLDIIIDVVDDYYVAGDSMATLKDKLKADQTNVISRLTEVSSATEPAISNITETVNKIKAANADTNIYVLDLYNPFESLADDATFGMLNSYAGSVMETFNAKLQLIDGITVIPVNATFKGNILDLTNFPADITKVTSKEDGDVHPNNAGHEKIAQLLLSVLDLPAPEVTTTTTEATTTTATEATTTTAAATTTVTTAAATTTTAAVTTTKAATTTTKAKTSNSPATSDKGVGAVAFTGVMSIAALCAAVAKKKD